MDALTVPQRLLLAAHTLEQQGQRPFSAEALAVRVWEQHPEAFGLAGFTRTHPDSNKCLSSIMGQRGMVSRGWFDQPEKGSKRYQLSLQGRTEAAKLANGNGKAMRAPLPQITVPPDLDEALSDLFGSDAYHCLVVGRDLPVTAALDFFGLSAVDPRPIVEFMLDAVADDLQRARAYVGCELTQGKAKGMVISTEWLDRLAEYARVCRERLPRLVREALA